ncbi:SDR family oxidoreductase [Cellulomonas triticagri]|uniref:SDR family oxidoreductase n=1 Tax=Cellulomonas triticagri TaxID=2483352 RepID=A0A3M2JP52_9CELL|nr:SDR family oxidoreductase [Cellulomonas triticagri]RMI13413.1 SDR family oxidoreductase [Cellulomonas triticagri]
MADYRALVVGVNGIIGAEIASRLAARDDWEVLGLSRSAHDLPDGVRPVLADLQDAAATVRALADLRPTHVYVTAWSRQDTEAENIRVNGQMVRHLLDALAPARSVRHVALMTGLKHYMGPFEAFGTGEMRETPFREESERLDVPNFYYAQEDELFAAAARDGFTWSVHRAHTVTGHAVGNAMNFALTLAVQAAIARETSTPLVFPGTETVWNCLTDMSDSSVVADQMIWASTTPGVGNEAWNVTNGEVFRWRWLWPRLADALGVTWEGPTATPRPLVEQMADKEALWARMAATHGLREPRLDRAASFWHTDSDLGVEVEVLADMTKSRLAGFRAYVSTEQAFLDLFDRYEADGLVPARPRRG